MVLKCEFNHLFKFPFHQVIEAYFRKYENGRDPNVQGITVEEHWKDDVTGLEYWRRSGKCINVCPWFLRKLFRDPSVIFIEEMTLNKQEERLIMHSRNITFSNYILLEETSEYKKSAYNKNWTQFIQHGRIDGKGLGTLSSLVERLANSFLLTGGNKGINIMEEILSSHLTC
eukprot:Seg14.3 transcript_id=Seg14.3/GoldUCD/mRNA.D3Y31 product="PRELI domain-containing protein 2" protein_id=Seg14.3/GoldUCD/D3Y31